MTRPSPSIGAAVRPSRRTVLTGAGVMAGALLLRPAQAAAAPPATPSFGPSIDPYAAYVGQTTCDPTAKPGVVAFRDLLQSAYGPRDWGITRECGTGSQSEHKEGRAWDMRFNAYTGERAQADELIGWLLAADQYGNQHARARRFGIMYIIWNRRIWSSNTRTWASYSGANDHTDHIHFSFSWAGARKQTSWWTGGGSGRERDYSGDGFGDLVLVSADGFLDYYPNNSAGGGDLFRSAIRSPGATWGGVPAISGGDLSGDGVTDLMVVAADGHLDYYPNNGRSNPGGAPFTGAAWRSPSPTWGGTAFIGAGDVSGDGRADLMAIGAEGFLDYYPNNSSSNAGGVPFTSAAARSAEATWGGMRAFTVGDLNRDGLADLMVVASDGYLYGYHNTGRANLGQLPFAAAAWRSPEPTWGGVTSISATDVSGDGFADLLAVAEDGHLYYYPNNSSSNPGGMPFTVATWRSPNPTFATAKLA